MDMEFGSFSSLLLVGTAAARIWERGDLTHECRGGPRGSHLPWTAPLVLLYRSPMRFHVVTVMLVACQNASPPPTSAPSGAAAAGCEPAACEGRCAGGDVAACARAAELSFDGKNGHPLDMAKSFRLAAQACAAGNMHGCLFAGYHYQDGLGTDWNPARAVETYERACSGGSGTACFNLGSMYSGGHGIDPDLARAEALFARAGDAWKAACDGDEPRWCTNAAFRMRGDEPSPEIRRSALALDRRACAAGVLVGCVEAARSRTMLGELAPADYVAELQGLCDRGEPIACAEAGETLIIGKQAPADPARGIALVKRACEGGQKDACYLIGLASWRGELVAVDKTAAIDYLTMACDRAYARACAQLTDVFLDSGDEAKAIGFARRACQMNDGSSCGVLAAAYLNGRGVAPDERAGVDWARESCRGGFGPGCRLLIERGVALPLPADLKARVHGELCAEGVAAACPPK
jgi:TPR repeat protein